MILPTKHLKEDRSLLWIGSEILSILSEPKTISGIWEELKQQRQSNNIPYDWFILALDFIYTLNAVDFNRGRLRRVIS